MADFCPVPLFTAVFAANVPFHHSALGGTMPPFPADEAGGTSIGSWVGLGIFLSVPDLAQVFDELSFREVAASFCHLPSCLAIPLPNKNC